MKLGWPHNSKAKKKKIYTDKKQFEKNTLKKTKLDSELFLYLWPESWDQGNPIKDKPKKRISKILNQTNIERWNWGKKVNKKTMQNKTNNN